MDKYWYRKDVATVVGCTVYQVRSNEKRWGITQFRRDLNCRCVRYLAEKTRIHLEINGIIQPK